MDTTCNRFGRGSCGCFAVLAVPHGRGDWSVNFRCRCGHACGSPYAMLWRAGRWAISGAFPALRSAMKGAASHIFLRHAVGLALLEQGFQISNIDCTLVCEYPRSAPILRRCRPKCCDHGGLIRRACRFQGPPPVNGLRLLRGARKASQPACHGNGWLKA